MDRKNRGIYLLTEHRPSEKWVEKSGVKNTDWATLDIPWKDIHGNKNLIFFNNGDFSDLFCFCLKCVDRVDINNF